MWTESFLSAGLLPCFPIFPKISMAIAAPSPIWFSLKLIQLSDIFRSFFLNLEADRLTSFDHRRDIWNPIPLLFSRKKVCSFLKSDLFHSLKVYLDFWIYSRCTHSAAQNLTSFFFYSTLRVLGCHKSFNSFS